MKARLCIIKLEARLAAQEITANVVQRTLEERLSRIQSSHSSDDPSNKDKTELSPGASNQAKNVPEGAGSESSGYANMDVGSTVDIVRLPGGHVDDCLCGITNGNDSNDYFNSDLCLVAWSICRTVIS